MEVLEEQLRMIAGKSESISSEFIRAKELLSKVNDPRHLQGLEGVADQRNVHEMREEETLAEI